MADPPSLETAFTGGVIGVVLFACSSLIGWFRSAAKDGEDLADQRIAVLLADFEAWRKRAEEAQAATDAEVASLRQEVTDYQTELAVVRAQYRACLAESHQLRVKVDALEAEVHRLQPPESH